MKEWLLENKKDRGAEESQATNYRFRQIQIDNMLKAGQLNLPYSCFIQNGEKASRSFLLILKEKYLVKKDKSARVSYICASNFLMNYLRLNIAFIKENKIIKTTSFEI